jgi:hypothetical protein
MGNNTDRKLYVLFLGLFAVQVGLALWNLKEQREWRKIVDKQNSNNK